MRISTPVSVILTKESPHIRLGNLGQSVTHKIVSSNWADLLPSAVTAVQSSFQCSKLLVPRLIIGSIVNT